jgi:predicted nucleic acid-binding protein
MGQQIIGFDTPIFIYIIEDHPIFYELAKTALQKTLSGSCQGVFSVIGLIELLTGPKKENRPDLVAQYRERILNFPNLNIKNLNSNIIEISSDLHAKYTLNTPDAIHLATSIDAGASVFYTNDKNLKKIKEIKVQTL